MKRLITLILSLSTIGLYAQDKVNDQIIQTIEGGIVSFDKIAIEPTLKSKLGNSTASINTIDYLPNESFEVFLPTDWDSYTGGPSDWLQDGGEFNTGSYSAYSDGEPYADSWLITPEIDLSTATSATLSYYELFYPGEENLDEHNVLVSFDYTNNGNPYSATWNPISTGVNNLYSWDFRQIDLINYLGSPIYIAFQYVGNDDGSGTPPYGFEWYIDDVSVTDDGSGGCSGSEPAPDCATISSPPNGATKLLTDVGISWHPPYFEDMTQQLLYAGSDGGGVTTPTNIYNGIMLSNFSIGTTLANLSPNTTYYWQVIPVNCDTEAENCPIWSFTTGDGDLNTGGGGPTQANYIFDNSISGTATQPSFSWIDISGSGTDLISTITNEQTKGPYNIGFPFSFFGNTYTQFYINSNGFVTFGNTVGQTNFPQNIPGDYVPDNLIAGYWMNLNPENTNVTGKHIYYGMSGGNMVITFEKYPQFNNTSGSSQPADANGWITFQIILKPNGDVKIQYKEKGSSFVDSDFYTGTVGIENNGGTTGITYRRRDKGGPIFDGTSPLALEFSTNFVNASAEIKIFLEGPYSSPSMNHVLDSSIPLTQPYSVGPWNYSGGETTDLTFITTNNIVDWVYIELRQGSSALNATNVVSKRAALLRNDGVLLDLDGSVDIDFSGVSPGDYYIVVFHRNHLQIISSLPVTF